MCVTLNKEIISTGQKPVGLVEDVMQMSAFTPSSLVEELTDESCSSTFIGKSNQAQYCRPD